MTEFKLEKDDNYMLVALRRRSPNKDENMEYEKRAARKLISGRLENDLAVAAEEFASRFSEEPGFWRMYRSVNKRNIQKGMLALQHDLIDRGEDFAHKIDSEWKSILMKSENKAERLFLVDIDTDDLMVRHDVINILKENKVEFHDENQTPNGYHIITSPFNPKLIAHVPDVELKKDALFFLFEFGDSID